MINIPLGENFESLVRWLKSSFKGLFDGISAVLNFSIEVLENTFLLESEGLYPSILFGLLLAFVVGLLGRRLFGAKAFFPVLLVTAIMFGGAEYWRVKELKSELTPELASSIESDFQSLLSSLEEIAPEDFSEAKQDLSLVLDSVPESDDRDSAAYEVRDSAGDGIRDIERARSSEYDEVYDALESTIQATDEGGISLPEQLREKLETQMAFYQSLILIEESERLIDDLREVTDEEERETLIEFINERSYEEIRGILIASEEYYSAVGKEDISKQVTVASKSFSKLNPNRLMWFAPVVTILLLGMIAYMIAGSGVALFSVVGFLLIISMELWIPTVETLALVLSATLFALLVGIPAGILSARSEVADRIIRPILDFMQTMPAFVYLIPAVIFFGLGKVPGAIATLVFAMPPAVRLTSLGIRQVPSEVVEAAQAFGSTGSQLLFKAQLPIAMTTILAGVNQTIMLALSMVVIGGMIGAGGLGEVVLSGITQMKLGLGFEGGIAVVILAIYLDRVTQALGAPKS